MFGFINLQWKLYFIHLLSVLIKLCGSNSTIGDPDAQVCVPGKRCESKVFNLMSGVIETRFLVQHESCESKYRLNESASKSKQKWNLDECRIECKKLGNWAFVQVLYVKS